MRYIKIPYVSLLLLIFFSQYAVGQEVEVNKFSRFVNLNVQDGLSHSEVNDILQDTNGFMWFATENGLSRYDGYSFVNFYFNPTDSTSIPGNIIVSLALDSKNQLWVGTTDGLGCLNLSTGVISRFMVEIGNSNTPRSNHIRKLYFSSKTNLLWIETYGGILTSYNISTNSWKHYTHQSSSQPYYRYHAIFEDNHGDIWVGGRNTPVMKLDVENESFRYINALGKVEGAKRDNDVSEIIQTTQGNWYVMGLDGIYEFFPDEQQFNKIFSSSTFSAAEDDEGNVWFGSGYGLLKYAPESNGFVAYRNNKNNSHSIANNHVNSVFIDNVGNIWAGTENGVSLLTSRSRRFYYSYNIPGDEHSLSDNEVSAIAQDSIGNIYVGTPNNGLNILPKGMKSFTQIKGERDNPNTLSAERIRTLYVDSEGMLWIGLWAGVGFNKYNPYTGRFSKHEIDKSSFKYDWYNAFLEDSEKNFYAGIWGNLGVRKFNRNQGTFTNEHFLNNSKPSQKAIRSIQHDGLGNYFMLSKLNEPYVYHYSTEFNEYTSHSFMNFDSGSISDLRSSVLNLPFPFDSIVAMHSNGKGIVVFATNKGVFSWSDGDGFNSLYRISCNPVDIKISETNHVYIVDRKDLTVLNEKGSVIQKVALPNNGVTKIEVADNDSLFLFNSKEFFYGKLNTDASNFSGFFKVSYPETVVLNHVAIINKTVYISTSAGLLKWENSNNVEGGKSYTELKRILDFPVSHTTQLNSSSIMVFSPLGIYILNTKTDKVNLYNLKNISEGFTTNISTASMLNANTIWVGSEAGHFQINIESGEIINSNLPGNDRISSHLVTTLLEDDKNNLWVGTSNMGLNRISKPTGYIKHFYAPELPSNNINATYLSSDGKLWVATTEGLCFIADDFVIRITNIPSQLDIRVIVEDNDGMIWAGTNNGLLTINPETYTINLYNEFHGFPSANFTRAGQKLKNGTLLFGTTKGLVAFEPSVIFTDFNFSNRVGITHFDVFDQTQNYFINHNDTIVLSYKQNFFEIYFSLGNYGFAKGASYAYKLNSIDPDWVTTSEQKAAYTNISPGRYTFYVMQARSNSQTPASITALHIFVKPAFWQTIWFKMLVVIILLSGIFGYLYTYIRQIKAASLNIELEQKLLISQMNPHFIFNSLSAIQSFMYRNQAEDAGNYLSSFSRLVRLILENSRSASISVEQEVQTLELYLTLQKLRFPDKFDYSINITPGLKHSTFKIPPMMAQPFIENSIEHGLLHKREKGNIHIELSEQNGLFSIVVEDDGVGLKKSKEINLNKNNLHTSYATSITHERIMNMSKGNKRGVGVKLIDLFAQGKIGTRVEIVFPVIPLHTDNNINRTQ